jgi:hypothetical protein
MMSEGDKGIYPKKKPPVCVNCGEDISKGGHYVPPSTGDKGFFYCEKKDKKGGE